MGKQKTEINKKSAPRKSGYRFIFVFACVFISVVLVFGIVLGTVSAVKSRNAVVEYKGITMDGKTASFFVTYYKYMYMRQLTRGGAVGVADTDFFWSSTAPDGEKTYGELLREGAELYIRQMMAANWLYDKYASFSGNDRDAVSKSVSQVLTYKADSDKSKFNSETEKYGFDYSSFKTAAAMMYKAIRAKEIIYGSEGTNLANFPELAAEYLAEYSHVKLLFIRTETTYVLDENGNRVVGENNQDELRELTDGEKAERLQLISKIRSYISAIDTGGDVQMGEEMFNLYLSEYDEGDKDMHGDGYYFHPDAEYTKEFASAFSQIVNKAFEMKLDSYSEVAVDFGVCFIYKSQPTAGIYASTIAEDCFSDFYENAADVMYDKSLTQVGVDVIFKKDFAKIDIVSLPYNYIYIPSIG
jgi:hypothetical protein